MDIPALYDPDGRYGRWNVVAITTYVVGIVVQIPFLAQSLYTGPVTKALGGADISWIVGLVVPGRRLLPLGVAAAGRAGADDPRRRAELEPGTARTVRRGRP